MAKKLNIPAPLHQRAEAKAEGLPGNACAPDLFTRIDALKAPNGPGAEFPVRWIIGFSDGSPFPKKARQESMLETVGVYLTQAGDQSGVIGFGKNVIFFFVVVFLWVVGYLADLLIWARLGPPACDSPALVTIKADIHAKELIASWIGADMSHELQIDRYARNYVCPTESFSFGEAQDAYFGGVIDWQSFVAYGRMNNKCDQVMQAINFVRQEKINADEWEKLYSRGEISEENFRQGMRHRGWIADFHVDEFLTSKIWYPSAGETARWAELHVTDELYAQAVGLDDDFEARYRGDLKEYFNSAHVDPYEAKLILRGTYRPVDLGMAFDLYRRGQAGMLPAGKQFTDLDLEAAIQLSALPPAYREAVKSTVYAPLGFRQLKTLYDESIITYGDVVNYLIADGFSRADGERLADLWKKGKPEYFAKKIGATGPAGLLKLYAQGAMGATELRAELVAFGLDADEVAAALVEAKAERTRNHRAELVKWLKARYIRGEVVESQVQGVLLSIGLEGADVADLLRLWRIEFEVHPRQVSASELCTWYKDGIINRGEFLNALLQLRYTTADAERIVLACEFKQVHQAIKGAKQTAAAHQKEVKAATADLEKELKAAEKYVGQVEQRILTEPGKLLQWVKTRVVNWPKTVQKQQQAGAPLPDTLDQVADDDAQAFIDEIDGSETVINGQLPPGGAP
jgi:hypothetical protein